MIEAFVFDIASGETLFRIEASTYEQVTSFALAEGQGIYECDPDVQCAHMETYQEGDTIALRPRQYDPVLLLSVAKMQKRQQIIDARDRHEWAGCMTPLGRMDTTPDSQRKINGSVTMAVVAQVAGAPFLKLWTMENNSEVAHDAPAMIAAGVAVGTYVSAVHAHAVAMKAQVDAAEDIAALDAIDITQGWP